MVIITSDYELLSGQRQVITKTIDDLLILTHWRLGELNEILGTGN